MKRKMSHLQIIALGYVLIIAAGTLLLMLPAASAGAPASFSDAFFTSVSASCVTGLVVRDTGTEWTFFGQLVIILLIQTGGLGFMTIASLFFKLLRRKVGLREKELMVESLNTSHVGGILDMTRTITVGTAVIEGAGAVLLAVRFVPMFGFRRGVWYGVFHSVSAFCNAGFDLMGARFGPYSSLTGFSDDLLVNVTVMLLVVIGGIGFMVWDDVRKKRFRLRKYALHSKIVLSVTGVLILGGALMFFFLEPSGGMGFKERVLTSLFACVTPRTAGFNTIDVAAMSPGGKILTVVLMFIGGSSGSTAGGIKTTTVAVILLYTWSQVRRRQTSVAFHREIEPGVVGKAMTVFVFNLVLALAGALLVCAIQPLDASDVIIETFSAIGTVGMSTGITRQLCAVSRFAVAFLMFCGRVGSVSFALAMLEKRARPPVTYPHEKITVG